MKSFLSLSSRVRKTVLSSLLALTIASAATPAFPCGYSGEYVFANYTQPDFPLDHFLEGHIGILRPRYLRMGRVIAFRYLAGSPLAQDEQMSAARAIAARVRTTEQSAFSRAPAAVTPPEPTAPWTEARTAALNTPAPSIGTTYFSDYQEVLNCHAHAFATAAETLRRRLQTAGSLTPSVRAWIDAQDQVFANCPRPNTGPSIPASLPNTAPALDRADRAYQIASAQFYAGQYDVAAQSFERIARDNTSPWQPWGRYLAARAITRRGSGASNQRDPAALQQAVALLRTTQATPSPAADPARRYLTLVQARLNPVAAAHELGVQLARGNLGVMLGPAMSDYSFLLDFNAEVLAPTQPDDDRLSTFLSVLEDATEANYQRAYQLYTRTRSPAWLVAALSLAQAQSPNVETLFAPAQALPATNPGALSAKFHRLRLLIERTPTASVYSEVLALRSSLTADDGRSAANQLTELAMLAATDADTYAANSTGVAVGFADEDGPALPSSSCGQQCTQPSLYPNAAERLGYSIPLSVLARVARAQTLPAPVRAHLSVIALLRAGLLDNTRVLTRLAEPTAADNPAIAPLVRALARARSAPQRKFALLHLLSQVPQLGPYPRWWAAEPATPSAMDSSTSVGLWCNNSRLNPAPARFLTAAERTELERETAAFAALGTGPEYLARESAQLAQAFRTDPRTPELLHRAVMSTRWGCTRDNSRASRAAFQALHALFPRSEWATRTRYYY